MKLEKPRIHKNALDVLANQIVGITIDFGEVDLKTVIETIRRSSLYDKTSDEEIVEVIDFLDSIRLVKFDKNNKKIIKTRKGLFYYIENLSMIPDEKSFDVYDVETGSKIGILHEEFVVKHGSPGTIFILRGLPWKIISIEKNRIYVSLEHDYESAIPSWEGELLPVPFEVAQEATEIKKKLILEIDELKDQKAFFIPDKDKIYIESYKDWFIIHSPFGSRANDTLSRLISYIISDKKGIVVGIKTDPYRIMIKAGYITKNDIKEAIENIPEDFEYMLIEAIRKTDLFLWKFDQVAKRFGVIRKDANYSKSTLRRISESLENTPVIKETIREIFLDKLDIEIVKNIIQNIKSGKIQIIIVENSEISPLGMLGLSEVVSDVLVSQKREEIRNMIKERLWNTEFYFICMNCKSIYGPLKAKEYKSFKCKKCGGELFGVIKNPDRMPSEKVLNATSELLRYYGRRFLFVYAGKGVTYQEASRIIINSKSEEELLQKIIEAEKRFFRVRKYI